MTPPVAALACLAVVVAAGCAPPAAHTTFLNDVDLVDMTDRMAQSFAADPVIGRRSESSDPWIISLDRVVNHTNQIIPSREKWLYVARLRLQLAASDVAGERSFVWVIPPERWPAAPDELPGDERGPRLRPTHLLGAEFQTLTNTSGAGRSDMYVCSFQLTEIAGGRLVWEDWWEVKRAVSGLTYD